MGKTIMKSLQSLFVAIAAFTISQAAASMMATADEPTMKWPHCEISIDAPGERLLADEVARINGESRLHPVGSTQEKIAVKDVMSVIEMALAREDLNNQASRALRSTRETKKLSNSVYLRRFSRVDDGQQMRGVWWIRLIVENEDGTVTSFPVREVELWSRPYTQMERQQHAAGGLTLINRFVSYYRSPPKLSKADPLPKSMTQELINRFTHAAESKDLDQLQKMFVGRKTNKPIRDFVRSELQMVLNSKIHSIRFRQQEWQGDLVHWSAFQHYHPNAPVVGFVDIEHTPARAEPSKKQTLSLEVGRAGSRLWFVNYIAGDSDPLPKALPMLSWTTQNERLADKSCFTYSSVENAGVLVSAHVSNEEVWHRAP